MVRPLVSHDEIQETLRVNEIFGPTIQGEGPHAGRRCVFVRLAMCNLACFWCDTPYTWAWTPALAEGHRDREVFSRDKEEHVMGVWEVVQKVRETAIDAFVVVSGGEPLMQQLPVYQLAKTLKALGYETHIETAGTIAPRVWLQTAIEHFTVSPKLASSGNRESKRFKLEALEKFSSMARFEKNVTFKFVITEEYFSDDLLEVRSMVETLNIPYDRVQLMPEGITAEVQLANSKRVAMAAIEHGFGFSSRLHTLIWNDERKR